MERPKTDAGLSKGQKSNVPPPRLFTFYLGSALMLAKEILPSWTICFIFNFQKRTISQLGWPDF